MSYGHSIPQIINGLNKNDFGMRRIYETFCVKKEQQELGLFKNAEIKANIKQLTEKYPFSSFQKINCVEKIKENDESMELEKEISRELGQDINESFELNFENDQNKIVEVRFTMQPTMDQKKKEIEQLTDNTFLSKNILKAQNEQESYRDQWIDDVVGGYYIEDDLDYSHIQDSSFIGREGGSMTQKLSSIEARPILWMVLFEWKNPNHLDKLTEMNLHDLKTIMDNHRATFQTNTTSFTDEIKNHLSRVGSDYKLKKNRLREGRMKLKVSSHHFRFWKNENRRYPIITKFLKQLQDEIEMDN